MTTCTNCGTEYQPRQLYHRYCDTSYTQLQGWDTTPRLPRRSRHPLRWAHPDRFFTWFFLVALPAIIIYAIGPLRKRKSGEE